MKSRGSIIYVAIIALVGVIIIALVYLDHQNIISTYRQNLPYITLTNQVKNKVYEGNLAFQKYLLGDENIDFDNHVIARFDEAILVLQATSGDTTDSKAQDSRVMAIHKDQIIQNFIQSAINNLQRLNKQAQTLKSLYDKQQQQNVQPANDFSMDLFNGSEEWTDTDITDTSAVTAEIDNELAQDTITDPFARELTDEITPDFQETEDDFTDDFTETDTGIIEETEIPEEFTIIDDFTQTTQIENDTIARKFKQTKGEFAADLTVLYKSLSQLETHINQKVDDDINDIKLYFWLTITLIALVFGVLIIIIYRIRRKNDKITADNEARLNKEMKRLKKLTLFVDNISKGEYTTTLELDTSSDALAKSLVQMKNKLKEAEEEEKKRKLDEEQRNWITQGVTLFSDLLRQDTENLEKLGSKVVKNLVDYLGENQGGLFVVNDDDQEQEPYLELIAAYAFNRKKYIEKKIYPGEGLVGACALEKDTTYLTEIPDDYLEIRSGLGGAAPNVLLVTPLKVDDHVFGVIEIASFNELQKYQIDFVEKVSENIASTLSNVKINARTAKLLEQTRIQAEEKAAQEEEMRQNMEELQATQEESARREAELSALLNAIDLTTIRAELNLDATIVSANYKMASALQYNTEQLEKMNIRDLIQPDTLQDFENAWKQVLLGKQKELLIHHRTRVDDNRWLMVSFSPMKDRDDEIHRVLFLATDVTEQKHIEIEATEIADELKQKEKEMQQKQVEIEETNAKMLESEVELKNALNRAKLNEKKLKDANEQMQAQEEEMRQSLEQLSANHQEMQKKQQELELANKQMAETEKLLKAEVEKSKQKEKEMLEKDQELKEKEEELQQNMEEIETTQEELQRRQKEIEQAKKKIKNNEQVLRKTFDKNKLVKKEHQEMKLKLQEYEEKMQQTQQELAEKQKMIQELQESINKLK